MNKIELRYLNIGKWYRKQAAPDIGFVMVEEEDNEIGLVGQWHSLLQDPVFRLHTPVKVGQMQDILDALGEEKYVKDDVANQKVREDLQHGKLAMVVDNQSPWPLTSEPPRDSKTLVDQQNVAFTIVFDRRQALEKKLRDGKTLNVQFLLGVAVMVLAVAVAIPIVVWLINNRGQVI